MGEWMTSSFRGRMLRIRKGRPTLFSFVTGRNTKWRMPSSGVITNGLMVDELWNVSQGTSVVDTYFIELKSIWEELRNYRPLPHCECGSCNPSYFKKYTDHFQNDMVFRFLNGWNESFSTVRSQIILMDPILSLDKVYSLVLREETQRNLLVQSQPMLESFAMLAATDNKKKLRKDITCNHCGKKGHIKDKCYKIIGFPNDFKFTKGGRSNPRKGKNFVNDVSTVSVASAENDYQVEPEEELTSTGFMC
ncbi:Uncharacterized protein TCM_002405 [Theobroma cacao]|uniref:CCHC-type domain-containing protein n=1 Tax=Theobroma cacao TaxID=3641 RepID=A0A061DN62_THECC|nr:Uncharacterized protein TCM_002405 [Theobroma cacao]